MKILLIYPYFIEDRIQSEDIHALPIGLYYVAAVLKENHYDVEILNWHNIHRTPERIKAILLEKKPDVIGFSILHANRWGGIEIGRIAKELYPKVKIVFGGIGATFLWEHFLTHFPDIDFVIIGEGEYAFLDLIRWIEKGAEKGLHNIKGLAFRKNGKIVKTQDVELIPHLDQFPIPAKYFEYQLLSSSRGCPWRCTFCGSPKFWRNRIRFRSPENFVEELEMLYKKGITFFYFSDDTFTIDKDRVIEICKRILEMEIEISWYAISRVDYVDDEILYWMRRAGCTQISYGIESGSEKIRELLNKKINTTQIKKAFALTRTYGILPRAYFIYGSPGETWETIQETVDLILEIKPLSVIFYILDLFPGTELYAKFKKRFHVKDDIWLNKIEGIMHFETDPNLSDQLILDFGKKLRAAFYEKIHAFVDSIDLKDEEELYPMHSDFYSRLGMTFSHGDYSNVEAIQDKDKAAEKLFEKSLFYYPNVRAYLGLGILNQKKRSYEKSIKFLSQGIESFPDSEELNICLGISYMNLNDYHSALSCLLKFPDTKDVNYHIAQCYKELGDHEKESLFLMKASKSDEG
jgi:radical SAM superfamily enzyme YgiQ (UPF0313 family)